QLRGAAWLEHPEGPRHPQVKAAALIAGQRQEALLVAGVARLEGQQAEAVAEAQIELVVVIVQTAVELLPARRPAPGRFQPPPGGGVPAQCLRPPRWKDGAGAGAAGGVKEKGLEGVAVHGVAGVAELHAWMLDAGAEAQPVGRVVDPAVPERAPLHPRP